MRNEQAHSPNQCPSQSQTQSEVISDLQALNRRLLSHISPLAANPYSLSLESLKHKFTVAEWLLTEQATLLNAAAEIAEQYDAFTVRSYEVLNRQDERLIDRLAGEEDDSQADSRQPIGERLKRHFDNENTQGKAKAKADKETEANSEQGKRKAQSKSKGGK